ncbi:hypothetical protein ABZ897_32265 [Nonomuraea sp. NPDC046802]|uniref:hypothetical protein n=1 Tax=Nonomuraea sp. NPDC046802 TaxID=3154919 RepID=UPI0034019D07
MAEMTVGPAQKTGRITQAGQAVIDCSTGEKYLWPKLIEGRKLNGTIVRYTLTENNKLASCIPGVYVTISGPKADRAVGPGLDLELPEHAKGVYSAGTLALCFGVGDKLDGISVIRFLLRKEKGRINVGKRVVQLAAPANSIYVDQENSPIRPAHPYQLYYCGPGTAWTKDILTCTGLAMIAPLAKRCYLSHSDSRTNVDKLATEIMRFFEGLPPGHKFEIVLFYTQGEDEDDRGSVEVVSRAIGALPASMARRVTAAAKWHEITSEGYVVVTPDKIAFWTL